jgi:hypothetical protein
MILRAWNRGLYSDYEHHAAAARASNHLWLAGCDFLHQLQYRTRVSHSLSYRAVACRLRNNLCMQ